MIKRINCEKFSYFEQMNDGIAVLSRTFAIEYANPAFIRLVHVSCMPDIQDSQLSEFVADYEDASFLADSLNAPIEEVFLTTSDGSRFPVEVSLSPSVSDDGSLQGYIAVVRDVSCRWKTQERLKQTMQKYKDLAQCSCDWLWETDAAGTYINVSPSVKNYLGYSPDDLFGKTPFDLMPAEEGYRVASIFNRIASRNESFKNLRNINISSSGGERVLVTSGMPVFDENGELKGYRGTDRDITEEVKTADALKSALEATNKIIRELPVGVIVVDRNKRILHINQLGCTVTGRKQGELTGELCHTAFCPSLVDQCPILDLNQKVDRSLRSVLHRDGHEIPVVKTVIPIIQDSEDVLLEVFIDVSETEYLKKNLEERNTELERLTGLVQANAGKTEDRNRRS